jgi:hypothetical protein
VTLATGAAQYCNNTVVSNEAVRQTTNDADFVGENISVILPPPPPFSEKKDPTKRYNKRAKAGLTTNNNNNMSKPTNSYICIPSSRFGDHVEEEEEEFTQTLPPSLANRKSTRMDTPLKQACFCHYTVHTPMLEEISPPAAYNNNNMG